MKSLTKLMSIVILGIMLTSCAGAFITLLDVLATILLVFIGIVALIIIVAAIFGG